MWPTQPCVIQGNFDPTTLLKERIKRENQDGGTILNDRDMQYLINHKMLMITIVLYNSSYDQAS